MVARERLVRLVCWFKNDEAFSRFLNLLGGAVGAGKHLSIEAATLAPVQPLVLLLVQLELVNLVSDGIHVQLRAAWRRNDARDFENLTDQSMCLSWLVVGVRDEDSGTRCLQIKV